MAPTKKSKSAPKGTEAKAPEKKAKSVAKAAATEAAPAKKKRAPRAKKATAGEDEVGTGGALVIVESPTKARSIGKYLGRGYEVKATIGHVRDLPTRKLGVDVENGFQPDYVTIKGKTQTLADLKKAAKRASSVYLATDPDREGEAIAWHVAVAARHQSADAPGAVRGDHQGSGQGVDVAAGRRERGPGQCPTGAPHPRSAGRLQGESDPVAEHQDRAVGRTGADGGPATDRRARTGYPGLQAGGVLDHRRRLRPEGPDVHRRTEEDRRAQSRTGHRSSRQRRGGRGAGPAVRRYQGREEEPAQAARCALHHQYPAAGSGQEAGLLHPPHHAGGAGSVRRYGCRGGWPGRPHHLHANRLRAGVRYRHCRGAGLHRGELRQGVSAGSAQPVHLEEGQPGPGRARSDPADRREAPPRGCAASP